MVEGEGEVEEAVVEVEMLVMEVEVVVEVVEGVEVEALVEAPAEVWQSADYMECRD